MKKLLLTFLFCLIGLTGFAEDVYFCELKTFRNLNEIEGGTIETNKLKMGIRTTENSKKLKVRFEGGEDRLWNILTDNSMLLMASIKFKDITGLTRDYTLSITKRLSQISLYEVVGYFDAHRFSVGKCF